MFYLNTHVYTRIYTQGVPIFGQHLDAGWYRREAALAVQDI